MRQVIARRFADAAIQAMADIEMLREIGTWQELDRVTAAAKVFLETTSLLQEQAKAQPAEQSE